MKATESKIDVFFSTAKTQFVIPVYQRNYDWNEQQCALLLNDIINIGENENIPAHFIGSIVYIRNNNYTTTEISELTIIDGQQRITTFTLIYIALMQLAKQLDKLELFSEINETYVINKFSPAENKFKLRTTANNTDALKFIYEGHAPSNFNSYSRIIENFKYFTNQINHDNLEVIKKGLSRLIFVEISLERGRDDPQRIFESLNSTGLELSEADLIRNYILMGLTADKQEQIYSSYWKNIEIACQDNAANQNKISDFIRDFLTLRFKKIPNKRKIYEEFKSRFTLPKLQENHDQILSEILVLSQHYSRLINPELESDLDIRLHLNYIKRLQINTAYPFLMQVYKDYTEQRIDKKTFINVLELIQSYIWRRFLTALPTNALNKIFMSLYERVDTNKYLESIEIDLMQRSGTGRFPKDNEIIEALKLKDLYNIDSKNRLYLFERLENFNNKEKILFDRNITIEHIFPKNPDKSWLNDLDQDEINLIQDRLVNTLGNLTLTGYNSELSNASFTSKRDKDSGGYRVSNIKLNQYLAKLNRWDAQQIQNRTEFLTKEIVSIWSYPTHNLKMNDVASEEINIFDAGNPTNKKLSYAIIFDRKIEIKTITELYEEVMRHLFSHHEALFVSTELKNKIELAHKSLANNLRSPGKISESYCIEFNLSSLVKFERLRFALEICECTDEVYIKYAD